MTDQRDTWRQLLALPSPWQVLSLRQDDAARRFDLWIGLAPSRSWLGRGRRASEPMVEDQVWRHVNFGHWRVVLHVAVPAGLRPDGAPWMGERDMPFSHQLAQQVAGLFRAGVSDPVIGELLDLPVTEVSRFRYALEGGELETGGNGAEVAPADVASNADIPPLEAPVWAALVDGRIEIDIRELSFKLLLGRMRAQLAKNADRELRALKLQEFHRYFASHRQRLGHELAQLKGEADA